ncbi:MAG: PepSY domain-containing protein [Steroidobacteraceae bacterium]
MKRVSSHQGRARGGAAALLALLPAIGLLAGAALRAAPLPAERALPTCPAVFAGRAAVPSGTAAGADERQPALQAFGGISLDQAVDLAQRRYGARVVRAEVSDAGGRRVYVLRLLSPDGRVWVVRVDAESGAME